MKEFFNRILELGKDWFKPRTIFAALFYGTYLYLILKQLPIPAELNSIISTLFGYWFGQRKSSQEQKEEKKI